MNTIITALAAATIAVGAGVAAAIGGTGTASASADGFLSALVDDGGIRIHDQAGVIRDGHRICGALANGYSMADVIAATKHDNPGLTWYDAGFEVGAAIRHLC